MAAYLSKAMGELAKELSAGLLRLRKGYVDAAEALLRILQPGLEYPYELVVYRLTAYRPRSHPIESIAAQTLRHDLQRMILDICDSFDLPEEAYGEQVFDTVGLARRLHVSTKTVQRWRCLGLVARKLVVGGQPFGRELRAERRKRVAYLESSIRFFAANRGKKLLRSARFSQLSYAEREGIISRARRLVGRTGCCLNALSRHLAKRTGRAVETVRYTIRKHDLRNPAQAVFPNHPPALDEQVKEVIYRCFLHGVSVPSLAASYGRTRGSIYRVINEMRARQLLGRQIEYVYNPQFDLPGAEEAILAEPPPAPAQAGVPRKARAPRELAENAERPAAPAQAGLEASPYFKSLYELPLLAGPQEQDLFRRYNFLKHQAGQLRRKLDPRTASSAELRRIERLLVQADAVKNQIVRANLRLVVSIAKRHMRGVQNVFELISDGNISLMRAVEKFDYSRGFKFSTYGSWAIIKNFARSVPKEKYLLDRFVTGGEEGLDLAALAVSYEPRLASNLDVRDSLRMVLGQLTPRERSIIVNHYGLDEADRPQTLEQLSRTMGISKERVRQIEQQAMAKLRTMLQPVAADLLGQ